MDGEVGLRPRFDEVGQDRTGLTVGFVRSRADCLIQLLNAFQDIADFDDIHQAAKRLDIVQAWIRDETRAAAADIIFDDEADHHLRMTTKVSA